MARYIRLFGLASLLVVDDDQEINDLIAHPALARDFEERGPFINQTIVSRLRRDFENDGEMNLSMRPRDDKERVAEQAALHERLSRLGAAQEWDPLAIAAAAEYIRTGEDKDRALAALTYATAFPFIEKEEGRDRLSFDEGYFSQIFKLYRRLSRARRPFSLRGALISQSGGVGRAQRALRKVVDGDDYGFHALSVTMDNSIVILDKMREAFDAASEQRGRRMPFRWPVFRTAPDVVVRQLKSDYVLPHAGRRLPAYSLVLLRMRRALRDDSFSGFEFAARQWSACPAHHYLLAYFGTVWGKAVFGDRWEFRLAEMPKSLGEPWEHGDLL